MVASCPLKAQQAPAHRETQSTLGSQMPRTEPQWVGCDPCVIRKFQGAGTNQQIGESGNRVGRGQLVLPCIGARFHIITPSFLLWGAGFRGCGVRQNNSNQLYLNVCEGFGGKSLPTCFESAPTVSPAFESDLNREVVFLLKKDM